MRTTPGSIPADLAARNADNDYERVAAQVINGNLYCNNGGGFNRLAADQAGNLYAVMSCNGPGPRLSPPDAGGFFGDAGFMGPSAFVAVSPDGGRSFGTPVNTNLAAHEVAVTAGSPGVAVVAASGPGGFSVIRTEDAGATWQPPQLLKPYASNIRLVAAGDRMLLTADTDTGRTWWLSEDGGRSFPSIRPTLSGELITLGMDSDGTIWIVTYDGAPTFHTSHDGGKTFEAGPRLPTEVYLGSFVVGPSLIFGAGKDLLYLPRDGSAAARSVPGLPEPFQFPHLLVPDEKDNVVVVSGIYGMYPPAVEVRRLAAGASSFASPRALPSSDVLPAAVPSPTPPPQSCSSAADRSRWRSRPGPDAAGCLQVGARPHRHRVAEGICVAHITT